MKFKNWFWGLFFIVAACLVIVNQLGYLTGFNIFTLIASVFLVAIIIQSATHLNFAGILFPFAILGIMFAEPLGIQNLVPWPILIAALFGTIGLSLIFSKSIKDMHCHCNYEGSCNKEHFDEIIDSPDESTVSCKVNFGSAIKYVNTQNFQKGFFDCSFGAMKVYFDNAHIEEDQAEIYLDLSFGGVELYIPKNWDLVDNVSTSLAGIDYEGKPSTATKKVVLNGKISFGGVTIIYV